MMFRKLTKYIAMLLLPVLAGCDSGIETPSLPGGAGLVTISLRNGEGETRANDDNYNESRLDNVVVALYPAAYGDESPAVALQKFTGLDAVKSTKVSMTLTDDMVRNLFNGASGTSCKMYVVANVENLEEVSAEATIAELKSLKAGSRFDTQKIQSSFVMAGQGTVTYSNTGVSASTGTATGTVTLERAAAKIRLNISLPAKVEQDGETWMPVTSQGGVRMLLNNGVKRAVAAPGADFTPADDDYYSITTGQGDVVRVMTSENGTEGYPYHNVVPFYTYPNHWEPTPDEQHRTSMTLIVPWQKQGSAEYQTFYYEVPVTDGQQLVSNYSYIVNLKVNMLGSLIPDTPEEVTELSYQIVDWGKEDIDVSITDYRYLVVNPSFYEADNEAQISIPFYSSHEAVVTDIKMSYNRYNYYSDGNGDVVTFSVSKDVIDASNERLTSPATFCSYGVSKDPLSGQYVVNINHPLVISTPYTSAGAEVELTRRDKTQSDWWSGTTIIEENIPANVEKTIAYYTPTTAGAYSAYTIEVTIAHADDPKYSERLTITQYPAMYIVAVRNPGRGTNTSSGGNVIINNAYSTNDLTDELGSVTASLSGNNANPNMYVINISTLDEGSGYWIGDPRTHYYNNDLSTATGTGRNVRYPDLVTPTSNGASDRSWSATAKALYPSGGGNRRLTYYYPTIESQDDQYKMMVAPKFRVASSYGKTSTVNRDGARRRMASYQELNCPAGRWRLPTYGELQFIISLSSTGKIPKLFTDNSTYWTAQGPCKVNGDGTITQVTANNNTYGSYYVRGVYDEWYWEEKTDYVITPTGNNYTFTWGDMPR